MSHVIVIGGGAAGMMAAVTAARRGHQVELLEKNEKLGKKIYITGKGRCNLTNTCEPGEFFDYVCSNPRFLYSSFGRFDNRQTMDWFEEAGLRMKKERGGRVFPVSDHASDVTAALEKQLYRAGVKIQLHTEAAKILFRENKGEADGFPLREDKRETESSHSHKVKGETGVHMHVTAVRLTDGRVLPADAVIVCTGGLSYPTTGSTGDGYRFARESRHTITPTSPSLVPMNVREQDIRSLQGLSLRNVRMRIRDGKKVLTDEMGEMLFTHFGVSGPLVLSASARIGNRLPLQLTIDLKPALSQQQLDARFVREFRENANRQLKNILTNVYPASLIPVILGRSGIPGKVQGHDITKAQRQRLAEVTKDFTMTITGLRDFNEAIITRGGVSVGQIRPDTMESRLAEGLYFAGEVLDVDALTGGFNLQIAWTTGHAAGEGIR